MDQEMTYMKTTFYLFLFISFFTACKQKSENESIGPSGITQHEFILIPGGEFTMGCEPAPDDPYIDNYAHRIHIDSFYIDKVVILYISARDFAHTGSILMWGSDVQKILMKINLV